MGKIRISKIILVVIISLMVIWPLYQLYNEFKSHSDQHNVTHLLYQVTLLQMEWLDRSLADTANLKNTQQLNTLKQAVYSANYTHERLAIALDTESFTELQSIQRMTDYITRLQIGADRLLKPEEIQAFQEASKLFNVLYEDYAKLMSSNEYSIITSENTKIQKSDKAIAALFSKKLLQ